MFRTLSAIVVVLFASIAPLGLCLAAGSARADIPPGFTRIFDGKTTKGWHFSGTVHHGTTGIATVTKDGVLQLTQRPFGQGGLLSPTRSTRTSISIWR